MTNSNWPADVEQMRAAVAPHEVGTGPFALTTRLQIQPDVDFRCVHRFLTAQAREAFRAVARHHGLTIEREFA